MMRCNTTDTWFPVPSDIPKPTRYRELENGDPIEELHLKREFEKKTRPPSRYLAFSSPPKAGFPMVHAPRPLALF